MVGESQHRTFVRVTKANPCPVCKKPDWCGLSDDGQFVICMRVDSDRAAKNGGHVHRLTDAPYPLPAPMPPERPVPSIDAGQMMSRWRDATTADQFATMAGKLGVSAYAIMALGAAFASEHRAWAFPMYDDRCSGESMAVGIRLRNESGDKWAVKGSRSGFFFPFRMKGAVNTVLIVEGPTDAAAAIDLGFLCIGRASCRGGESQVMSELAQLCPSEVVMVYDNDGPGVEGAELLASKIQKRHRLVRMVPPTKDLRSFVRCGGTRSIFDSMLKTCVRSVP